MTLGDNLLESLNAWRPAGESRSILSQAGDDWTVSIDAERNDSVGCLLSEMTLTRSAVDVGPIAVRPWAERVANRVTGLVEPLKVIEVDDERNEAILRSTSPSKKGSLAQFYEVQLAGVGMATVKRYKADTVAGTRREQVSFALTHEVIAKLADDLVRD